ncbi:MAG: NAD(P)-dependent oxidoreductase [Desulfobacula sp.]|jgi:nucleoside-diphosphate-sugar epimerase
MNYSERLNRVIAVTGGTGFIGKRLVLRLLEHGYSVRVLTRKNRNEISLPECVQIFEADLADSQSQLDDFFKDVEVLYHCAGELKNTSQMPIVHIDGTKRLVSSAKNKIKHWVQLSSVGVYGKVQDGLVDEKFPLSPVNIYEKTKIESDKIVSKESLKNNFSFCILRPANVYGIGMPGQSLGKLIDFVSKGFFFFVGPPGARVNFIHVDDVVDALLLCGNTSTCPKGIFNLSDSQTIETLVTIIAKIVGKKPTTLRLPEYLPRAIIFILQILPGFPLTFKHVDTLMSRVCYSNDRLVNELGYSQKITLEDGLQEYIAFRKSEIKNSKLEIIEENNRTQ